MMTTARSNAPSRSSSRSSGRSTGRTVVQEEVGEAPTGNLFDLGSDDKVVYVWRHNPVSKKLVFMFKLAQDEATEEEIQRLAGGGKFTCREKERNDDGLMVFGRHRTVEIGGAAREPGVPKATQEEIAGAPGTVAAPVVGVTGEPQRAGTTIDDVLTAGILRLFTSQAEASETQSKMYQAMLARPHTDMDWGKIITALVPMVTAMIDKKNDAPSQIELIEKVASLMKTNTNPTSQFKDMLETVDSVFSIKEQAAGPPADPLTAMAAQLPKILEIISSEQQKGRTPTVEEVQQKLTAASTPPKVTGAKMPMYQMFLNRFAPMLLRWAREGKDPELLGEFLVQSIPEKYHGALREFLARDDSQSLVYQTIPDLRNYPAFTDKCFGTIADIFSPEEEEEEVAEPVTEPMVTYEIGRDGMGQVVEERVVEEVIEEETTE